MPYYHFHAFPLGWKFFSAGSDEQFEYIKRVLDTVDYYVLIVGGRYGSIAKDGKSYTEKEFDLAFNTLGGVIGGLLYYIFRLIQNHKLKKTEKVK